MVIQTLIFIFISLAALTNCTPCPQTEGIAGGGPPNSALPSQISRNGIKNIQLAQFIENMEASFFSTGSLNISDWGSDGYSNSSIDTINRIAAVSTRKTKYPKLILRSKMKYTLKL